MATLVHQTGELEVQIHGIAVKDGQLVIRGTLGVWDANIFVPAEEVGQLGRLIAKPGTLGFLLRSMFRVRKR